MAIDEAKLELEPLVKQGAAVAVRDGFCFSFVDV